MRCVACDWPLVATWWQRITIRKARCSDTVACFMRYRKKVGRPVYACREAPAEVGA